MERGVAWLVMAGTIGVGAALRRAREIRGITLDEAARDTKLRPEQLEALEGESFEDLGDPVYARAMLRTYAQYLGLKPDRVLSVYAKHGEEVARWGRVVLPRPEPDPVGERFPLRPLAEADWPTEPLESVILRRGSTRRFDVSRSLAFEELSTALAVATASIPADFTQGAESSLLDLYVIAHAVEGLQPGAYYLR